MFVVAGVPGVSQRIQSLIPSHGLEKHVLRDRVKHRLQRMDADRYLSDAMCERQLTAIVISSHPVRSCTMLRCTTCARSGVAVEYAPLRPD